MLRKLFATMAMVAMLASSAMAGDCGCNSGGGHGYVGQTWSGYCDGGSCDSCGGCGCNRCCFPIISGVLHHVGKTINCLIPKPCCHRSCCYATPNVGCCETAGNWNPGGCGCTSAASPGPGYMPAAGDPFIDDAAPPTPAPTHDSRYRPAHRNPYAARGQMMVAKPTSAVSSRPVVKAMPLKTASQSQKPAVLGKPMGKSVLKVTHEEPIFESADEEDLPPAPKSVRQMNDDEPAPRQLRNVPANPLR